MSSSDSSFSVAQGQSRCTKGSLQARRPAGLTLFFLLLLCRRRWYFRCSSTSRTSCRCSSGASTRTDIQQHILDVLSLKCLKPSIVSLSLPSFAVVAGRMVSTLANRVVHMGSTSSSFAALIKVWSLSAYFSPSAIKGTLSCATLGVHGFYGRYLQ